MVSPCIPRRVRLRVPLSRGFLVGEGGGGGAPVGLFLRAASTYGLGPAGSAGPRSSGSFNKIRAWCCSGNPRVRACPGWAGPLGLWGRCGRSAPFRALDPGLKNCDGGGALGRRVHPGPSLKLFISSFWPLSLGFRPFVLREGRTSHSSATSRSAPARWVSFAGSGACTPSPCSASSASRTRSSSPQAGV